jgi:hypothetical protein
LFGLTYTESVIVLKKISSFFFVVSGEPELSGVCYQINCTGRVCMPIVFVHGVNNRLDSGYRDSEKGRNGFLREIVAPALGLSANDLHIANPYWGDHAAQFAWGMAVLPQASDKYEKFGGGDPALASSSMELVSQLELDGSLLDNAKKDFAKVVDLIYAAALADAATEQEARDIATSYLRAAAYAAKNPAPAWLAQVNESNFVDVLNVRADTSADEQFGGGGLLDSLKEGWSRLANALPDAGTELAGKLARKKLNAVVTRFTGDAFVYLSKRGAPQSPGPIVQTVLDSLREASNKKTATDNKLIVIAHSFGGEIVYDILTQFDPQLQIDCLITVGSQVGLFEEMKLYLASRDNIPPNPPDGKVARPLSLKRWLNVFDTNDILSYRLEPVFAGVDDYLYDTGFSSLEAHGGYFERPSFYKRLAARLTQT